MNIINNPVTECLMHLTCKLSLALSSEIVFFGFAAFVLYIILTLLFVFVVRCAFVASNKYYVHTYIYILVLFKMPDSCNVHFYDCHDCSTLRVNWKYFNSYMLQFVSMHKNSTTNTACTLLILAHNALS